MDTATAPRSLVLLAVVAFSLGNVAPARSYGWPIEPFHEQHPVRAYFGDPRIGSDGRGGQSRTLHFGIDISAPNGTPVYSIGSGRISLHPLHPTDVVMVESGGVTYEYWHIVPAVRSGNAIAYKTLLGRIAPPWAHVHFAERRGSTYVNPLRPGALGPYRDSTPPIVRALRVQHDRRGGADLIADAFDTTPLTVAAPWNDKPVTPARIFPAAPSRASTTRERARTTPLRSATSASSLPATGGGPGPTSSTSASPIPPGTRRPGRSRSRCRAWPPSAGAFATAARGQATSVDERERRLAANERFFRDVNEQIGGIARSQGTDRHFYEFLCECSNTDCDLMLPLRISEYELARQDATVFIVTPGHDLPDIETVVEHTSRYDLVRKHGEAAELAELDNPRR